MSTSIPKVVADFETALDQSVAEGDTTASLLSVTDTDGVALVNGYYGFTIDNDTAYKEFILCTLTGTALTAVFSVSDQGVATSGFANYHRRGAVVQITDHVSLRKVVETLTGATGLDGGTPIFYNSTPSLGDPLQLATVQYVLDTVNGGAVSFNAETIDGMAGETIASGDWVYLKESDGRWYKTDADVAASSVGVRIGKARGAGTAGAAISGGVFINGLETVGTYAAFTTYYLSGTAGALSTSAGTYSVVVGISDGNSKLIVAQTPGSYRDAFVGSSGIPSASNKFQTAESTFSATADQSQTTRDSGQAVGEANATTKKNKQAQSFIAGRVKIGGVELYKDADSGSFTGTVTVALQADSAGAPSGVNLVSGTITNAQWLTITTGAFQLQFTAEYAMVVGTTYWIVVSTSTSDNTNHPNLGANSSGGYANGILRYNNTTDGWVTVSGIDLYFKTLNGVVSQIVATDSTGQVPYGVLPYSLIDMDTTVTTTASSTAETTVYTKKLPEATFKTNTGIRIKGVYTFNETNNGAGSSKTVKVKLNGTTVATLSTSTIDNTVTLEALLDVIILNNASLSAQKYGSILMAQGTASIAAGTGQGTGGFTSARDSGSATIDTSSSVVVTVTIANSQADVNAGFTTRFLTLERIG